MSLRSLLLWGAGAFAVSKAIDAWKTNKAGEELAITIGNVGKSKMENGSLMLWAEVWFDNFTSKELHLQQPTVKIFLNDKTTEVGHVLPSNDVTDVPANGRNSKPCTLRMAVPLSNLPGVFAVLIAGGIANKQILIEVSTKANGYDYSDTKAYTI